MKFFSSCVFGHGDRYRSRDDRGRLVLVCEACGDEQIVLGSEIVKGPKHTADVVPGQPRLKVLRRWPDRRKVIHG